MYPIVLRMLRGTWITYLISPNRPGLEGLVQNVETSCNLSIGLITPFKTTSYIVSVGNLLPTSGEYSDKLRWLFASYRRFRNSPARGASATVTHCRRAERFPRDAQMLTAAILRQGAKQPTALSTTATPLFDRLLDRHRHRLDNIDDAYQSDLSATAEQWDHVIAV